VERTLHSPINYQGILSGKTVIPQASEPIVLAEPFLHYARAGRFLHHALPQRFEVVQAEKANVTARLGDLLQVQTIKANHMKNHVGTHQQQTNRTAMVNGENVRLVTAIHKRHNVSRYSSRILLRQLWL
jgi:hypothetical protein